MGDEEMRERVISFEVGERIDSDHQPIVVRLEKDRMRGEGERKKKQGRMRKGIWSEEGKEAYGRKMKGIEVDEKGAGIEEKEMEKRIKKVIEEVAKEVGEGGKEKRGWWDKECGSKKEEVRRELRRWRKRGGKGEEYKRRKREFKELCLRKKREENERWERKVLEVKRECEVWEIINRERKRRVGVNEDISMEEWKEYFMSVLGGVEGRVVMGGGRGRGGGEDEKRKEEEELSRMEIREALNRLKEGKAMGLEGIPGEAWRYGGEEVEKWVWGYCNRVWKEEGWPEGWKEGMVVPIMKKGEGKRVEDYRGVTIMSALYKIYVTVLAERLRKEVEEKEIVPHNQVGFRKGMGTMDNIYVINYLVNRNIERGVVVALFVDLKAAFDSVDRRVMVKVMRERGIREGLVGRVEEILRETKSRVRAGDEVGESFWTGRGLRQGCPLSPLLFNILIADLEEVMGRVKWGGVKLGERKIYSLAYADDIVLLADKEEEMGSMIERLEKYLEDKGLELNVGKTKIMRFRKGGGRRTKKKWRWKGKEIEEVKEFKYLGYVLQRNGRQEAQVRDRIKRAAAGMGRIWGLGKRRFGGDWGRRLWLFDKLVWTVLGYGVEIWGWKEREGMERLEERYLRWLLGVDARTPGYLVREELQREKLRGRMGKRARGFERRLKEGRGSRLARMCWEEIRERDRRGGEISDWEKERKGFFEERGIGEEERDGRGGEEEVWVRDMEKRDKERQRKERRERIEISKYNRWYRMVRGEGIPEYLKKGWGESRWRRIARYRLGNEMREGSYWEREERRKCRLCENEEESWEHVWERCRSWKEGGGGWQEAVGRILGEDGEGEGWMRELEKERLRVERMEGRGEKENEREMESE